ncbi:MAG: bifunctional folylpolyglutamate synthase/dihydrofolate synthase [Candidatus Margulisbacteria bacterium]|nr:bifunctional folylpolyglutamate synthase/dihydrofolate synthase [Candidatus Margulisiibacteriota bacterium]
MTYHHVISELIKRAHKSGIKYSLDNFNKALAQCGNPHNACNSIIHVAGTNGKGSTIAFISSALIEMGYTVGTYTSPHIDSYTERICLQNKPISEAEFASLFYKVLEWVPETPLTEFEILTIMAFLYFKHQKPDFMIYETGLGGRLDATNVVNPIITLITSIGLDHQSILGDTLSQIASEKAGIIKQGIPVYTMKQHPKVMDILTKMANEKNAPIRVSEAIIPPKSFLLNADYQQDNYGIAVALIHDMMAQKRIKQEPKAAKKGFQKAGLQNRFEKIGEDIVLDMAHNPQGIHALVLSLEKAYPKKKWHIVAGIQKIKQVDHMLRGLSPLSKQLYYCPFDDALCDSYDTVKTRILPLALYPCNLQDIAHLPRPLLVTGSIYFLAKVKPKLSVLS